MADRVFVIGEVGSTHMGHLPSMLAMIDAGAKAGCDAIKFQWVSSAAGLCIRRKATDYMEAYRQIQFPPAWHLKLHQQCQEAGVEYMCTAYLPEDVNIVSLFVQRMKIASFEAGDRRFVRLHERLNKPVLISTGMCEPDDLAWLLRRRKRNENIQLLHCVSAYPAPHEELNLSAIRRYGFDGFSDHSLWIETGALAVAAGARIVEAHFRLDDCAPDHPDYPHSLTTSQLAHYVQRIRDTEKAMGEGTKAVMPCEQAMRKYRVAA